MIQVSELSSGMIQCPSYWVGMIQHHSYGVGMIQCTSYRVGMIQCPCWVWPSVSAIVWVWFNITATEWVWFSVRVGYDPASQLSCGYDSSVPATRWVWLISVRVGMIHRASYRAVFFLACFSRRSRSFCCLARSFLSASIVVLKSLMYFFSCSRCWALTMPRDCIQTYTWCKKLQFSVSILHKTA